MRVNDSFMFGISRFFIETMHTYMYLGRYRRSSAPLIIRVLRAHAWDTCIHVNVGLRDNVTAQSRQLTESTNWFYIALSTLYTAP
jgi:hypothetical protein